MFQKIASSTISQVFSKAVTAIISIFFISILTNYLTVELYWTYSKIYNYIWIFVFLADLGLYTIAIREITNNKKESAKIVSNIMTLRLIMGIIILAFAVFLAFFIPWYNSELAIYSIFIVCIFTIFQLINSSILALMQANMKIEFSALSLIFWKLVNLILVWFIAFYFYPKEFIENSDYFSPFLYIMCAWVIGIFINTLMNYFYALKIVKFWFWFDWPYIKHLFKISLPYWIALFLSVVYFKVDIIILSIMEWPDYWDISIALYSLPMKIVEVLIVLWWFYMTSILPNLTQWFKKKDSKLLNKLSSISFKILFSSGVLIFSLWVLFRDYLIRIIANENYINTSHMYNSSDAFLVVFAVVVFNFLSLFFIYTMVASENQSKLLKINIFITIFNIIWNILLIPHYSFIWAWIVTILSQIILTFLGWYFTRGLIKFDLSFFYILKHIFIGLVFFILGSFILKNYSIGLYFDFIVYWWVLFSFYSYVLYIDLMKYKKILD